MKSNNGDQYQIKKVLITGAAGFIGRHVAREFKMQGWHVVGIGHGDQFDWSSFGLDEWHCADINLETLISYSGGAELIIHCAGGSSVGFSMIQPAVDFDMTVKTTSSILEFIRAHSPGTRLVYPSSAAVYGQASKLPISEDAPLRPLSPYGLHKVMAESLCKLYAHQFGLSIAILRLFSIYGPDLNKQLLWDACKKFSFGDSNFFGSGQEVRDWLHIDDAAPLFVQVSKVASSDCPIVNAGGGFGVTVAEVLELLGAEFQDGLAPVFSSLQKDGDPQAYVADISRAIELNWEPKIAWSAGVLEYVKWYKTSINR